MYAPYSSGRALALVLISGQELNITLSLNLLVFAQSRLLIPYVDRLSDGVTPFSYIPTYFSDNIAITALLPIGVAVKSVQATINPPGGTNVATYQDASQPSLLDFTANAVLSPGYVRTSARIISSQGQNASPWPLNSYADLSNLPAFGPVQPLCWKVSHRGTYTACSNRLILNPLGFQHVENPTSNVFTVQGTVSLGNPPLPQPAQFNDVYVSAHARYPVHLRFI